MSRYLAILLAVALLAGCGGEPTPTPDPVATQVAVEQAVAATLTAAAPTPTPTPPPTATPTPTPTATPTPTPTITPTPTATLLPNDELESATQNQVAGNYVESILSFSNVLDEELTEPQAREAQYRLAESYLLEGEYISAAMAWEEFLALYPDDLRRPQATLMAALAYQAANRCDKAIEHFQAYLEQESILGDMVYEWIGDCQAAVGRLEPAITAYRGAVSSTDDLGVQVSLREKIAGVYMALEDHESAIAEYDAILEVAQIGEYRAKIEYLAGQALDAAGDVDAAFERYRRAVDSYPEAEHAYFSLVELVYGDAEVDEYQRGLIDYYAGAKYPDAYGASIAAFDRYLAAEPVEKVEDVDRIEDALYYKALGQRAVGQTDEALETLEQIIADYPDSEALDRVWQAKAATLAQAGLDDAAVRAYQDLAASFPASELAPEALWSAARVRQGEGAFAEAAALYEELQRTFPGSEDPDAALWYAGLAHYRAGNTEGSTANWQSLLETYPDSVYRPKAVYWLGKVGAQPEAADAAGYWDQLLDELPGTYYALRVQQLDAGESLTATRLISTPVESPPWDGMEYEAEIVPWLGTWTDLPTGTESLALPAAVSEAPGLQRGQMLLDVGLRREALEAFEAVLDSVGDDPLALAALGRHFRDRGMYGLAATSASRLAKAWPEGDLHDAPLALKTLAYPLAYADLLSAEAQNQDLDPLLLAGLVRQESLFEPAATSWVGARGLGQVMPATGEQIARELGVEDFAVDDLYRPSTSIRFGAHYLASQLAYFDDQILLALSAYNGGPGNAMQWSEAGGDDLDLFVEVITAVQSRLYLQGVYENYIVYEKLYR
jgi:soluble lytic murein transglycosylase